MAGILHDDLDTPASEARQAAYRFELEAEMRKAGIEANRLAREQEALDVMDDALLVIPGVADFIERERARGREVSAENVRQYKADFSIWRAWCEKEKVRPLPADAAAIANYLIERGDHGVRYINRVIAAIQTVHAVAQFPDPTNDPRVRAVVHFLRDLEKKLGKPKKAAPDATPGDTK